MIKKIEKYKSIGDDSRKDAVFNDYIRNPVIARVARKYELPYSTLRRFLLEELENKAMAGLMRVDYINVADFPFLKEGYTFQYDERFTIWSVVGVTVKESDKVFILIPVTQQGEKHFICDTEV